MALNQIGVHPRVLSLAAQVLGAESGERFGRTLASGGDLDGDDAAELLVLEALAQEGQGVIQHNEVPLTHLAEHVLDDHERIREGKGSLGAHELRRRFQMISATTAALRGRLQ